MIIIKHETQLEAWRLGDDTAMERTLLESGKLRKLPGGQYLVFSRETDSQGQLAQAGDYIKVDAGGFPYPNRRTAFEASHTHLGDCRYLQKVQPLLAWTCREPLGPEIRFLLESGRLRIDETDEDHYFRAFLWDAELFAARDAVVVFTQVVRDMTGAVTDARFHFLAREEFLRTYHILE